MLQQHTIKVHAYVEVHQFKSSCSHYMYNVQVCVRSLKNTQNGPSMPPVQHFVRAEMLPSGYLIRPCEGGGSIIHIVDHMDLEVIL